VWERIGVRFAPPHVHAERAAAAQRRGWRRFLRDIALILLAAVVVSFLIKTFLVRTFFIPSPSMEPTLLVDDRVLVNELVPDLIAIQHGDVVVFTDPGGWLTHTASEPNPFQWLLSVAGLAAPDSGDHLIKRVIGLPGDVVACCDDFGRLTVNGDAIVEPYADLAGHQRASDIGFTVTVPADGLWVMGDNRYNSMDSRYHRDDPGNGFVPISNVVGRAILVTWPLDRWSWIDDHESRFPDSEGG
jgi:signal peptidase I